VLSISVDNNNSLFFSLSYSVAFSNKLAS